jgi:hypothetical protein
VWVVLVLVWMVAAASVGARRVKRWIASSPSSMTTHELLHLLGQARGRSEGRRLISTVRRRGLLDDVPEAITVLEDIIVATERSSRWASNRSFSMPPSAEFIAPLRHGARLLRTVGRQLVGRPRASGPGHEPEPSPIGQARDPDVQQWLARLTRWSGPSRLLYLSGPDLDQMGLLLEHLRRRHAARADRDLRPKPGRPYPLRIVTPAGATGVLPILLHIHGAAWVRRRPHPRPDKKQRTATAGTATTRANPFPDRHSYSRPPPSCYLAIPIPLKPPSTRPVYGWHRAALRSTRNRPRRAMRQGAAWPGRRSDRAGAW